MEQPPLFIKGGDKRKERRTQGYPPASLQRQTYPILISIPTLLLPPVGPTLTSPFLGSFHLMMMIHCWICPRSFARQPDLSQHFADKHPNLYCRPCRRPFASKSAKRQHLNQSSAHNAYSRCAQLPEIPSEGHLDEYTKTVDYRCANCDLAFDSPDRALQHDVGKMVAN